MAGVAGASLVGYSALCRDHFIASGALKALL
jgi:hypothetical protein